MPACLATSKCFLTVERIERDEGAGRDPEFGEQRLGCGDFIGFSGNADVGQNQGRVGGQSAQHLRSKAIVEIVEAAAKRLAVERNAAWPRLRARSLQPGRMLAERGFDIGRRKTLEDIANGGVGRRPAPCETERGIQFGPMHVDEGDDAAIGVAAGHDR